MLTCVITLLLAFKATFVIEQQLVKLFYLVKVASLTYNSLIFKLIN